MVGWGARPLKGVEGVIEKCAPCQPTCPEHSTVFCPLCGKADRAALKRVRLMGLVGVQHSTSPAIEQFWETGDPQVFATRGGRDLAE